MHDGPGVLPDRVSCWHVVTAVVAALKVQVGKGGRFVGQNAIQLHGGMGMTDELNVGHYFKRITAVETLFGNADFHLKQYSSAA